MCDGLELAARLGQIPCDGRQMRHQGEPSGSRVTFNELERIAEQQCLRLRMSQCAWETLSRNTLPLILVDNDGRAVLLLKIRGEKALVHMLRGGNSQAMGAGDLLPMWSGWIIQHAPLTGESGNAGSLGHWWFVPAILRQRKSLIDILIASALVQTFALASPLLVQSIMDKVLVHQVHATLVVIGVAMFLVIVGEVAFSYLRAFIMAHVASRIDVELGSAVFRHLLKLPISFYEARRSGDTVARVRELEQVRSFLTGPALMSLLDLFFAVGFILVMCLYSMTLTAIVLASLPIYVLLATAITPAIRSRIEGVCQRGADLHSFLVESISTMGTVKGLAIEPAVQRRWDDQLTGYATKLFNASWVGALGRESIHSVSKLVTLTLLMVGATMVMANELTLGQLIAFNMLAGHVSSPIIRLSQLWQDYQRAQVSMHRLGELLEIPAEPRSQLPLPVPTNGEIIFHQVSFRYRPDGPEILRGLDLRIAAGETLGIVGASGSGKSTLTKLVQRLHIPTSGRILIDGVDIGLMAPDQLRRTIGTVMQENQLFRRTIRDNIAIAHPWAESSDIINAARLAAAHEFISELPRGYETMIEEHGANLSGGQRQRVAIARALMGDPRMLILDEATSALDYVAESEVMRNMELICRGRTVLIIAHRLSTVRRANRIIVLDRGSLAESGSHDELISRKGLYARLHSLQEHG